MKATQKPGTMATDSTQQKAGVRPLSPEGRKQVRALLEKMEREALAQRKQKSQTSTPQSPAATI